MADLGFFGAGTGKTGLSYTFPLPRSTEPSVEDRANVASLALELDAAVTGNMPPDAAEEPGNTDESDDPVDVAMIEPITADNLEKVGIGMEGAGKLPLFRRLS